MQWQTNQSHHIHVNPARGASVLAWLLIIIGDGEPYKETVKRPTNTSYVLPVLDEEHRHICPGNIAHQTVAWS